MLYEPDGMGIGRRELETVVVAADNDGTEEAPGGGRVDDNAVISSCWTAVLIVPRIASRVSVPPSPLEVGVVVVDVPAAVETANGSSDIPNKGGKKYTALTSSESV